MTDQQLPTASTSTVTVDLDAACIDATGAAHVVPVRWGYDVLDPYAVTLTFLVGGAEITWMLGRDLLSDGLDAPSGVGDVFVSPRRGVPQPQVVVELCSPDGALLAEFPADRVIGFLVATSRLVPFGQEANFLDVDTLLGRLLA